MSFYFCVDDDGGHIIDTIDRPGFFTGRWNSISGRYETRESLIEKLGIPSNPCGICHTPFSTRYMREVKETLIKRNLCFNCNFWYEYALVKDNPTHAIIAGNHYIIGSEEEDTPLKWRGHYGAYFKIRFNDGREIETTNLWHQGKIPQRFKEKLPDNAVFIQRP